MKRNLVTLLVIAALAVPTVWAGELAGVTMADKATVGDQTLQLNGMGLRKKLWIKVYVAGLYLTSTSHDAAGVLAAPGAKKMVMHFLTNKATKSKMDDSWIEGFKANSSAEWAALESRVNRFIGFFGDMKDGDVVDMTLVPDEGTTVAINGQVKGTIEGDDFATALLKVWIGDEPPTEDLKTGLLGG